MTAVNEAVARGKAEILEDMSAGIIPESIGSFSDLHDYVDANEYGGLTESEFSLDEMNTVQDTIDRWIKSGGHRQSP